MRMAKNRGVWINLSLRFNTLSGQCSMGSIFFIFKLQIMVVCCCLLGCSTIEVKKDIDRQRLVRNKTFLTEESFITGKPSLTVANARSIIFVADNQFHNIYTDASVFGARFSDMFSRVAIRPAALNLYSPELFSYVIKEYGDSHDVIHLGDALNVGCYNEWNMLTQTMDSTVSGNWVMAPGNHDFYFYGLSSGGWLHFLFNSTWSDGCVGSELKDPQYNRFFKNKFIDEYIDHLLEKEIISSLKTSAIKGGRVKKFDVEEISASNDDGFYRKVVARKYLRYRKHRSFVTQFVNLSIDELSPTIGVILDTTNYHYEPTFIRGLLGIFSHNAGLHGYVDTDQLDLIKQTLEKEFRTDNQKLKVVFIGHHPVRNLNKEMQSYLFELSQNSSFSFGGYVSAHTHSGFTATVIDKSNNELREYNLGSVTDWPIELAVISKNSAKIEVVDPNTLGFACDTKFDYSDSRISNYTAYRREAHDIVRPGQKLVNAQLRYYMQTLVRTIIDLNVINDDQSFVLIYNDLLDNLDPCEECGVFFARKCQDKKRKVIQSAVDAFQKLKKIDKEFAKKFKQYAVCQALWSSQAEYLSYSGNHKEGK